MSRNDTSPFRISRPVPELLCRQRSWPHINDNCLSRTTGGASGDRNASSHGLRNSGGVSTAKKSLSYSDRQDFFSIINASQIENKSEWALKSNEIQMTLNHRVPGSSPGAPTKPFKHLTAWNSASARAGFFRARSRGRRLSYGPRYVADTVKIWRLAVAHAFHLFMDLRHFGLAEARRLADGQCMDIHLRQ